MNTFIINPCQFNLLDALFHMIAEIAKPSANAI